MAKSITDPQRWQSSFFSSLAQTRDILELFDYLPGVYMYVKDAQGRFVRANKVVCDIVGVATPDEIIGKTDFDFFPPAIAAQYVEEDRRVIKSGQTLRDQVWLVPGSNGVPLWYLCNKIPLRDKKQKVIGIAGVKRPYDPSGDDSAGYSRLMKVVAFASKRFDQTIGVADLAKHVSLSVSQLQREFTRYFGITPVRYLREVRVGMARHLLENSDQSIAKISQDCGFYDQSHFARSFKSSTGMTPLKYRQRYRL